MTVGPSSASMSVRGGAESANSVVIAISSFSSECNSSHSIQQQPGALDAGFLRGLFAFTFGTSLELPKASQPDQAARSQQPQRMQLRLERQERNERRDGRQYQAGVRRFGNQRRACRDQAGCHRYEAELNVPPPWMVLEAFPGVHGRDRHD